MAKTKEQVRQELLSEQRITAVNETLHGDKKKGEVRKSAIHSGIKRQEVIDFMLKMKDGVCTTIELAFDGDPMSDATSYFRILTAREMLEIKQEMRDSKLLPNYDGSYELLLAAKMLSRASTSTPNPMPSDLNGQALFSEEEIVNMMGERFVLALGYRYDEFLRKHSPILREHSQAEIDDLIEEISEALILDPKDSMTALKQIFSDLDLSAMQGAIIRCVGLLKTLRQQTDKLLTGI